MSAILSECRQYRYQLRRDLGMGGGKGIVNFLMLNPSTADEHTDDPTISRCKDFAARWGYDALIVTNCFGWRATQPDVLYGMGKAEAVGPDNDRHIFAVAALAALVICAWGNHGTLFGRSGEVLKLIREAGKVPMALKVNGKSKQPGHPLYLKATTLPQEFAA